MEDIIKLLLIPALIVGGIGLVFGLILAAAAKAFHVKIDERILKVKAALPGVNCGACGQTGCESFAEAAVAGKVKPDGCPVGGATTAQKVAEILGVELTNTVEYVARVFCGGAKSISRVKYEYAGMKDCTAAYSLFGGPLACSTGCVGFGNCQRSCPFNAIVIEDGLSRIIETRCRGCENCVAACPKKLIAMVPRGKQHAVLCKSHDRGPVVKKNCDVGCIGCGKCVKVCPRSAITLTNNLAHIDPLLCENCGDCVAVCPTKAIRFIG